jgi:hypothetical protein
MRRLIYPPLPRPWQLGRGKYLLWQGEYIILDHSGSCLNKYLEPLYERARSWFWMKVSPPFQPHTLSYFGRNSDLCHRWIFL